MDASKQIKTPPTEPDVFLQFVRILGRHRNLILTLALGIPLIATAVLLFVPNTYRAKGTILVEMPEGSMGSDFMGQLSMLAGVPGSVNPGEIYLSILRSERVATAVIDSLDLTAHYKMTQDDQRQRFEKTLMKLEKRVTFDQPDFVTIHVLARDRDPQVAADIANVFIGQLEEANQTLAFSRARRTRKLVEEALKTTHQELDSTRDRIQVFQETYGVIDLKAQIESTMLLIGELKGQLLQAQAERKAMLAFKRSDSGKLKSLELRITALQSQIDVLMGTVESDADSEGEDYLLELQNVPRLASDYARLMMDLKVLEGKYNLLATRLEQTKIDESQSIPAFEVLDWARVPYRKYSPNRRMLILLALVSGVLSGIFSAFLLEESRRRFTPETQGELLKLLPRRFRPGKEPTD